MSWGAREAVRGCLPRARARVTCVPPASSEEVGTTQQGRSGRPVLEIRGQPAGAREPGPRCHPLLRATGPGLARAAPLPPHKSLPASPCTVGRGHREWGRGRLWHHRAGRPSWSSGSAGPSPRPLRPSAARCPGRHEAAVFVRGHVLRGRARGGGAGAGGARPDSPLPAPPRPLTCWARTPHPQTGKGEQGGGRGGGMDGHLGRRMGTLRTDGDT